MSQQTWKCDFEVWRDEDQEEPEEITLEFEVEFPPEFMLMQGSSVPWPAPVTSHSERGNGETT